jgi:hypothetical protein
MPVAVSYNAVTACAPAGARCEYIVCSRRRYKHTLAFDVHGQTCCGLCLAVLAALLVGVFTLPASRKLQQMLLLCNMP